MMLDVDHGTEYQVHHAVMVARFRGGIVHMACAEQMLVVYCASISCSGVRIVLLRRSS
jgi:hypothetical protein